MSRASLYTPVPRWVSFTALAVALILASSLLMDPLQIRIRKIQSWLALREIQARFFEGCEVTEDPNRSEPTYWRVLLGPQRLTVSLVDRTHSDFGIVYSIPRVHVYVNKHIEEVWIHGWGHIVEPVSSIIHKIEGNDMVSEFVQVTGLREAVFSDRGVMFSHGEYELVYAPPGIDGLEVGSGVFSYIIANGDYGNFEEVLELRSVVEQEGFTIPSDTKVIYGRYGGWYVKWNPEGCGKDTIVVHKPPDGKTYVYWISIPSEIDPSYMEDTIQARFAQMGLSREYVLFNFRLLEKKAVRLAHYNNVNGEPVDRTKVVGRFTYQWITGTPWVDSLHGGFKVQTFFVYRVDRPDSLYLRVGSSALESSTEANLHKIGRLISHEKAIQNLSQFGIQNDRFSIKMYPNGNSKGRGMIFLFGRYLGKHFDYFEVDLETGEVNTGFKGQICIMPDEIDQFRVLGVSLVD